MTIYNAEKVVCREEPTDIYHPTQQALPDEAAFYCLSAYCFGFTACDFTVLVRSGK